VFGEDIGSEFVEDNKKLFEQLAQGGEQAQEAFT
jgi:hypothetical protein